MASDNLSSSAYATEEMLHVLILGVGAAAFSLVVPITVALLLMLGLLILSYRQTIKAYPSSGGAYLVTRDAFGIVPAQVAGVALLVGLPPDRGGVGVRWRRGPHLGLRVARPVPGPDRAPLHRAGDLREPARHQGVGEALRRPHLLLHGQRGRPPRATASCATSPGTCRCSTKAATGDLEFGHADADGGLYLGAGAFLLAKAYASGGAAVTGVEAISNGVSSFREPASRNARQTLVYMGGGLAVMFLGISLLASQIHVVPFENGTPTVLAQIGEAVYGTGASGTILSHSLQAATLLILVLAANTGFAGFPALASFQARDSFLPRQLTGAATASCSRTGSWPWRAPPPCWSWPPTPRSPSSSRCTPSACSSASRCRRPA